MDVFEGTEEAAKPRRRRGILFVPLVILVSLGGFLLAEPGFSGFGLGALVVMAIGLPPSKTLQATQKPLWVGIGIFGLCCFAVSWDRSRWVNGDWLLVVGSSLLAALVLIGFAGRFLFDLVSKNRARRKRPTVQRSHLASHRYRRVFG